MTDVPALVRIDKPGLYKDLSHEVYHADPCVVPSLSSSIGWLLSERSPRHAFLSHPRLNPEMVREEKDIMDLGDLAHQFMLRDAERFVEIDAPDFRTNAAKDARDKARAANKIPILAKKLPEVRAMVAAGRAQLSNQELDPGDPLNAFVDGQCEVSLIWKEETEFGEVWCRCRPDWLYSSVPVCDDLKTTGVAATEEGWAKGVAFDMGSDFRAAFYERGYRAVFGVKNVTYRFIVIETKPPYGLRIFKIGEETMGEARQKVERAIRRWAWCMANKYWPGYPRMTAIIEAPPWKMAAWQKVKMFEQYSAESMEELMRRAVDFQAPLKELPAPESEKT